MTTWITRNAKPILLVLCAAVLVVGIFEAIDAFGDSPRVASESESEEPELSGAATLGGLIKVTIFLLLGAAIARPLRSRFRPGSPDS